jgi:hypothetical protein
MAEYTRKRGSSGAPFVGSGICTTDSLGIQFPALLEELTLTEWGPDEPRTTSTLLLFGEEGLLKACLHDRDSGKQAFVTGVSLSAVLASVEQGLRMEDLDWRNKRTGLGKKR